MSLLLQYLEGLSLDDYLVVLVDYRVCLFNLSRTNFGVPGMNRISFATSLMPTYSASLLHAVISLGC